VFGVEKNDAVSGFKRIMVTKKRAKRKPRSAEVAPPPFHERFEIQIDMNGAKQRFVNISYANEFRHAAKQGAVRGLSKATLAAIAARSQSPKLN
jgi:hypothetical protein